MIDLGLSRSVVGRGCRVGLGGKRVEGDLRLYESIRRGWSCFGRGRWEMNGIDICNNSASSYDELLNIPYDSASNSSMPSKMFQAPVASIASPHRLNSDD